MIEIWKDIKGYEGLYQISNLGNIKSFKRYKEGKLLKPKFDKDGYREVGIRDSIGIRTFKRVHILVAKSFISNPNNYKFINHKDNNPSNNIVENIEWCSIEYNNKYRFTNGNASHKGSKSPVATITEDVAIEIYRLGHSGKYTEPELAKMFNTTRSIVNKIRLNITWTHVTKYIKLV
jgi:hypothetical protein